MVLNPDARQTPYTHESGQKAKWPGLVMVRHGEAVFNEELHVRKKAFKPFQKLSERVANPRVAENSFRSLYWWITRFYDIPVELKFPRTFSDHEVHTELTEKGREQMRETGAALRAYYGDKLPDAIFVGTHKRYLQSLEAMAEGWPELKLLLDQEMQKPARDRKIHEDRRVNEQDFGLVSTYPTPDSYIAWHPRQQRYRRFADPLKYRYPQGESIQDTKDRSQNFLNKLIRDRLADGWENVLVISSNYWILSTMANLERWNDAAFMDFYQNPVNTKLLNGGITVYEPQTPTPEHKQGKLARVTYNAPAEYIAEIASIRRS